MKKVIFTLMLVFVCSLIQYSYAQTRKEIVFYNWKDYTDLSILEDFEKRFGIKVILKEYETKDMMLSEVQSNPSAYDVIEATDSTVSLLGEYRVLTEIDLTKIPNYKIIKKQFRGLPFDPQNKYSVSACLWGAAGLVINTDFVPADIDSWAVLWDKKYKGKISLMDDSRDAMSAVLKYSNFSINTKNPRELAVAEENSLLLRANEVQFGDTLGNIEKVISGEFWIAQAYNGDMVNKASGKKNIKFIYPKEGFSLTVDNFVISVDSEHIEEAYKFINFLLEPKNAARSSNTFFYPVTIEGADVFLNKENLDNSVIYPPQEVLKKGEFILDLGKAEGEYIRIFNLLKPQEK